MKFQLTLVVLLAVTLQHARAQVFTQFRQGDSIIAGQGCSQGFYRDYAFKPKDVVSYHYLDGDFGRDKFQAYAGGKPLPQLNHRKVTATFAKQKGVKEDSYWHAKSFLTDGSKIYYQSTLMQNADVKSIYFILDNRTPLYESNKNAYFGGHLLAGVDPAEIKLIEGNSFEKEFFFTDGKNVYRNEVLLADADAKTFRMAEYNALILEDRRYKYEKISDSRDKNNLYFKGRKIMPYPNWKETKLFPDSIYNSHYVATFTSKYQTQNVEANPAIDFYLSPEDFECFTKNKVLLRKPKLQLDLKPFVTGILESNDGDSMKNEEIKGYEINVFKDKEVVATYYYEEDLEELDIKGSTRIDVVGDGFYLSKYEFNLIRRQGKPVRYVEEEFRTFESAEQKVVELIKNDKVIHQRTSSYCFCNLSKKHSEYKYGISGDEDMNNQGNLTKPSSFEGVFTFRINRNEAARLVGGDLVTFRNEEGKTKRYELIAKVLGKGKLYIGLNEGSEYINGEAWLNYDIYCSKEFMNQVPKQHIQNEWHAISHIISWEEM